MSDRLSGLRSAVAFLTPVGGGAPARPEALWWFPAVGAATGLVVGLVWWVVAHWWPAGVAAAVALLVDLAVTGLLHVDGLCDAADGLLPPMDRERRLAVMREPPAGAFGVAAVVAVLLTRWIALASVPASILLPVALWTASRAWMATTIAGVPYARSDGLASAFVPADPSRSLLPLAAGGLGAALLVGVTWRPLVGPVAVAGGTLAAAGVVLLARRRLGGFTGDVLGAAGVVGETVGLLVAAARW